MARLKLSRKHRSGILASLIYRIIVTIGCTMRIELRNFATAPERTIYCGWHGCSFPFAYRQKGRGWWAIISRSRDGDIQNRVFEHLGYQTIRGSTGRDGERAAVGAIKALRQGGVLGMTPDGPRGPSGIVQNGIMVIGQRSGAHIVPVGVAVSPCWRINSWDRYMVPKPFSRALLIAGEEIVVPEDCSAEEVEAIRLRLQESINTLQAQAEKELAGL